MPSIDRRKHRLPIGATQPKNLNTLKGVVMPNDLFARADVNNIINELDAVKPDITDLIVIWQDKKGDCYHYDITQDTPTSTANLMLDRVKMSLLSEDD